MNMPNEELHTAAQDAARAVYDAALLALNATIGEAQARLADAQAQAVLDRQEIERLTLELANAQTPVPTGVIREYATPQDALRDAGYTEPVNIVTWKDEWTHLEQAHAAMTDGDVLWLPNRYKPNGEPDPYILDLSRGFLASGVSKVDAPNGATTPVANGSRMWFEATRARKGIICQGRGAQIKVHGDGWTAPAQPDTQHWYDMAGRRQGAMSGVQNALIGCWVRNPVFLNVQLIGDDLGDVAYNGLRIAGYSGSTSTVFRFRAEGAWSGFKGQPNGEAGALVIGKASGADAGSYDWRHLELARGKQKNISSPLMWNSTAGGHLEDVTMDKPDWGMPTYWYSGGTNVWKDVHIIGHEVGTNFEQTSAGFTMDIDGGSITVPEASNGYHLNGNPKNGSWKIRIKGTEFIGGRTPGVCNVHNYAPTAVQKKSDITADSPIQFWGAFL